MKNKTLWWSVRITLVLAFAVVTGAVAQAPMPRHFSGVINDYSPASVTPMGPWEIRGPWSLNLKDESGMADFSATLTMELSDFTRTPTNIDTTTGSGSRMQHTHNITMQACKVIPLPTGGFEVSGPVTITKDGSPAPLAASTLFVDITGGTTVEYSNITLTFEGGSILHFGSQAIHGVVHRARPSDSDDKHR
ncbi:MAG: hypothetical protein WBG02_08280 [Candidatus Acidiferrum sp.]